MIQQYTNLKEFGYEQITSLSSAVSLSVPAGARFAHIQAEGADVRYRFDGTNPTTTVGTILKADSDFFDIGEISKMKIIEVAASAKLNVRYLG